MRRGSGRLERNHLLDVDADGYGTFVVRGLPPGVYRVQICYPGIVEVIEVLDDTVNVTIDIPPPNSLVLQIPGDVDLGRRVAVELEYRDYEAAVAAAEAHTDSPGKFVVKVLPMPGTATVRAPGYKPATVAFTSEKTMLRTLVFEKLDALVK